MSNVIDPSGIAKKFRVEVRQEVKALGKPLKVVGFLTTDFAPSVTYANYTKDACEDVGIVFELREIKRLNMEKAIIEANNDPEIHGIFIYYPIFNTEYDSYLKDLVDHRKDIEGLNGYWAKKLYSNRRLAIDSLAESDINKAILPCTPLAILKILESASSDLCISNEITDLSNKTITIFNRSEVVGRPLAVMLSNDNANVYSFDINGPILFQNGEIVETNISRTDALKKSDIIITGVPHSKFDKVKMADVKKDAICLNFSTVQNFDESVINNAKTFIPRVGPVTVAMCLRNVLRLYKLYHSK